MARKFKTALKRFLPYLLEAKANNLNEADTVLRITKFFEDVLGYDALSEISRETQLKGKYVDMAIKLDGVIKLLLEAKPAGAKLRDRHIEQAEAYASRNNFRWVVLTNGVMWNLYRLTFEEGIENERVFSVDLASDDLAKAAEKLELLSKTSIKKELHEKYWERQSALSAASIGKCLFHEDVLRLVRREIRRELGILMDTEDLADAIRKMLSVESREEIGPMRIRRRRTKKGQPDKPPEHLTPGEPAP